MSLPNVGEPAFVVHSHCEEAAKKEMFLLVTVLAIDA
jgi:hypothetical protein